MTNDVTRLQRRSAWPADQSRWPNSRAGPMMKSMGQTRATEILKRILLINAGVAAAKILIGLRSGSLAIMADGLHSTTDGLNNIVAIAVLAWSSQPADAKHPYGHRRLEVLATSALGLILLVMAGGVLSDVTARMQGAAPPVTLSALQLGLLGIMLVLNLAVARWERREGRALNSALLIVDAKHTQADVYVTAGVVFSAFFTRAGYAEADIVAGILVAGFIGFAGLGILRENLHPLLGGQMVKPAEVVASALTVEGVREAHNVRSHGTEGAVYVDLQIHVSPATPLGQAHTLAHEVERVLKTEIAGVVDVMVHVEPADHD